MHCQVLASGSGGNAALIRAGELRILVDAGLPPRALRERFDAAGLPHRGIDHVLVTHGHLDHARSAGIVARRHGAVLHCAERIMRNRSVRRAPKLVALRIGTPTEVRGSHGDVAVYTPVLLPHDCEPTVAYRIEHEGRAAAIVTDMGRPSDRVAGALRGVHLLVLEFNYDEELLAGGPYPERLKRRVGGDFGHLSNVQAQRVLTAAAGPDLHTVVLAHLSQVNNTADRAVAAAREALAAAGLPGVEVLVASQDAVGPNLRV